MVRRIGIALAAFLVVSVFVVASASVPHLIPTVSAMGTVRLFVTDPPHYSDNVTHIYITFSQIALNQVNSASGDNWTVLTNDTTTIDLLALVNVTESLGNFSVPVGNYSQIRFLNPIASAVIFNGTANVIVPLEVPSGNQTGLKVQFQPPFEIKADGIVTITIDISANNNGIHNGKLIPSMHATVS